MNAVTITKPLHDTLDSLLPGLKRGYQRGINRELSQHAIEGLFARQVVSLVDALLAGATSWIDEQFFHTHSPNDEDKRQQWESAKAQIRFQKEALIDYALHFNRSSCALSNFPAEHSPDADYFAQVLTQVELLWQNWCSTQQTKLLQAAE